VSEEADDKRPGGDTHNNVSGDARIEGNVLQARYIGQVVLHGQEPEPPGRIPAELRPEIPTFTDRKPEEDLFMRSVRERRGEGRPFGISGPPELARARARGPSGPGQGVRRPEGRGPVSARARYRGSSGDAAHGGSGRAAGDEDPVAVTQQHVLTQLGHLRSYPFIARRLSSGRVAAACLVLHGRNRRSPHRRARPPHLQAPVT
jgi:hypothetical protein